MTKLGIASLSRLWAYAPWTLVLSVGIFGMYFTYHRGADLNFDLLNYHFYTGYALLHWRFSADLAPAGLHSFFNPLWTLIPFTAKYYLAFPWDTWVLTLVQLLALPILVLILRELEDSSGRSEVSLGGLLALALSLVSPLWWSELGTSFFSSGTSFLILLALLFALRGLSESSTLSPWRAFLLSGALMGLASGLKLTNAVYLIALPATLMPLAISGRPRPALSLALAYTLGAMIGFGVTAWWNLYLLWEWENPLFPFYNAIFDSPYYAPVNFRDRRWEFHSLGEVIGFAIESLSGTHKTSEVVFPDARIAILSLFAVATLFSSLGRLKRRLFRQVLADDEGYDRAASATLWFFLVSALMWGLVFAYQRYLIPLELLAGIVIWILAKRLVRPETLSPTLLVVLMLSLSILRVPNWGHRNDLAPAGAARFGLELPQEVVESPALYLVAKSPMSFMFPFFHPESRFARVDFTPRIEERMKDWIARNAHLPVRMITKGKDRTPLQGIPKRLGLTPAEDLDWTCRPFPSAPDTFLLCEANTQAETKPVGRAPKNLGLTH